MAAALDDLFRTTIDETFRAKVPNVIKWFEKVKSIKSFSKYFGRAIYCQKGWVAPKSAKSLKIYGPFGNYRTKIVCTAADIAGLKYEMDNTSW